VIAGSSELVSTQLLSGVAFGHFDQSPTSSPLWDSNHHRGTTVLAKPRFDGLEVIRLDRRTHDARYIGGRVSIEVSQDSACQGARLEWLDEVGDRTVLSDDPTVANVQHHDCNLEVISARSDHVEVVAIAEDELLGLGGFFHSGDAVSESSGSFVVLGLRRTTHLDFQISDHRRRLTTKEAEEPFKVLGVLLGVNGADTRPRAALDVKEEAWSPRTLMAFQLGVGAGANRKRWKKKINGAPEGANVSEWSEIP
jgi:hypothetical protein